MKLLLLLCIVGAALARPDEFHVLCYRNGAMVTKQITLPDQINASQIHCMKVQLPLRPQDESALYFYPSTHDIKMLAHSISHVPDPPKDPLMEEFHGRMVEAIVRVGDDKMTLRGRLRECGGDQYAPRRMCLEDVDEKKLHVLMGRLPIQILNTPYPPDKDAQFPSDFFTKPKPKREVYTTEICFHRVLTKPNASIEADVNVPQQAPPAPRHALHVTYPSSGFRWRAVHYLHLAANAATARLKSTALLRTSMPIHHPPPGEVRVTTIAPSSVAFAVGDLQLPKDAPPPKRVFHRRPFPFMGRKRISMPIPRDLTRGRMQDLGELEVVHPILTANMSLPLRGLTSYTLTYDGHSGDTPVTVDRRFLYEAHMHHILPRAKKLKWENPKIVISVLNTVNNSLGNRFIPAGRMLVYRDAEVIKSSAGLEPVFMGYGKVKNVPVGGRFHLVTGKAPNAICAWKHVPNPQQLQPLPDNAFNRIFSGTVIMECRREKSASPNQITRLEIIDTIPQWRGDVVSVTSQPPYFEQISERKYRWLLDFVPNTDPQQTMDIAQVKYDYVTRIKVVKRHLQKQFPSMPY